MTSATTEVVHTGGSRAIHCRALGVSIVVECGPETPAARLAALLRPLTRPDAASGPARHRLTVTRLDDGSLAADDPAGRHVCRTDGALLDHVQWRVNAVTIDDLSTRGTGFHAAAVQRDGTTLLLPAASEAGKSTLAALLVRDGWSYLSDEAVELSPDGALLPYPKAITVDPGSQGLFPEARPEHEDTQSWYVDPAAWGPRAPGRPTAPTVVAMPRFAPGHGAALEQLHPGPAVLALAPCVFLFRRAPERNLRGLGRLVRSTPVFRMTYGGSAEALAAVGQLVGVR